MEVEIDSLILALEDHSPGIQWFLDRLSGEIIPVTDPMVTGDEEAQALVAANPERYVPIEPMPTHESFEIMEAFVGTITSPRIQERLTDSLRHRHPFRAFKAALLDLPEVRTAWFSFHEEKMAFAARLWLAETGLSDIVRASVRPKNGA